MAEYVYRGVDKSGKRVSGKLDAASDSDARLSLRALGVRPTELNVAGVLNSDLSALVRKSTPREIGLSLGTLVIFTRQMHTLLTSGIPLIQSLEILETQASDKNLQKILGTVREKVASGTFLWESLSIFPQAFPRLYLALIRAGESSGAIDAMLKRLSRYLEDAERLTKMLKSAMIYPTMVVLVGIAVVTALLVFVIPKFKELLTGSGQELPAPTQFVIDVSEFLQANILYLIAGCIAAFFIIRAYYRTPGGRGSIQKAVFFMPIFGKIAQIGSVARFSRTMSTLLSSGVNLLDAIDICRQVLDNQVMEDSIKTVRTDIEQGKTLASTIAKIPVFPRMAVQMILVGENTGNLDKMLEKVADTYEQEVETLVGGLTKLIEPFILVFLGGTVGGVLIAMYLPIFKLAGGAE